MAAVDIGYTTATGMGAAVIPVVWAENALLTTFKNLVVAGLVYREYEAAVAQFGDVVNTRMYSKLTVQDWESHYDAHNDGTVDTAAGAGYVDPANIIRIQRPQAYKLPVRLNKYKYTSYIEEDQPKATSIAQIRKELIEPATIPLAEQIDLDVITAFFSGTDYAGNAIAHVLTTGGSTTPKYLTPADIVSAMKKLDDQLCPKTDRYLVLGSKHNADALNQLLFTGVSYAGGASALEQAALGPKYGFQTYMSQNIVHEHTSYGAVDRSLAFHRQATALIVRPLSQIDSPGAVSAVVERGGVSLRMSVGYNQLLKGTIVSFDVLYGTQLLNAELACYLEDGHA